MGWPAWPGVSRVALMSVRALAQATTCSTIASYRRSDRLVVLGEVPLDGRQDADQVLLADLHRPADPLVRRRVGGDPIEVSGAAQDQAGAGGAAQPLAAAEQDDVGAGRREGPQVLDRWQLRRGVDDDRDVAGRARCGGPPRAGAPRRRGARRPRRARPPSPARWRARGRLPRCRSAEPISTSRPPASSIAGSYGIRWARWMRKSLGRPTRSAGRRTPSSGSGTTHATAARNIPAAAPPETKAASLRVSSAIRRPTAACSSNRSTKHSDAWRIASTTSGGISEPPRYVMVVAPLTIGSTPIRR